MPSRRGRPPKKRQQSRQGRPPAQRTWATSDQDEILVRRQRAAAEPMRVARLDDGAGPFGDYQVVRVDGGDGAEVPYIVELRHLDGAVNTCTCPDFAKNGLGTCKHIERVLMKAPQRRRPRLSPAVEIHMARLPEYRAAVQMPPEPTAEVAGFMRSYLDPMGELRMPWSTTLLVLLRDLERAPEAVRGAIRVSREVRAEAVAIRRRQRLATARAELADRLRDPENAPAIVRHRLYDYQQEGMLHLAFTGRALLADEMGLGKTVQAIAACKVLHDLEGIRRVLIVCPASLKTEWEEQIRKFTNLPVRLVYGGRPDRERIYRDTDAFFVVANYEQILRDLDPVNDCLRPDVVILDEAQRIKNWQTKTARAIKRLAAPYAFVLTGTPLENRIDEIYSLVEFIDPHVFGSLFRFNRDFYTFDDRGRASGLKNMAELHERLRPIMLRRRKDQIAEQLPERIDNNYFVKMSTGQRTRYADYEQPVASLLSVAQRRPLSPAEQDKLQMMLSCMRMICDSVYILDQETKVSPKIDELLAILDDIWTAEPDRKVIVFSEWERMLYLLSQALDSDGLPYAWHTGSVPQQKRREEINRFKNDPDCRLFLSTDSGATGLNLQAASVVVNLDLPWNPAKLEQRIARAWRKHQKNAVQVINLVAESSIEHRMLSTLAAKQELADGVLDARGDLDSLDLPSSRATFLRRLEQLVETPLVEPAAEPAAPTPPGDRFAEDLVVKLGDRLLSCRVRFRPDRRVDAAVIVVETGGATTRDHVADLWRNTHGGDLPAAVQVMDRQQYEWLQQLAEMGVIAFAEPGFDDVYEADSVGREQPDDRVRRRDLAAPLLARAERQFRMAELLVGGGFADEALAPLRETMSLAGCILAVLSAVEPPAEAPTEYTADLHRVVATHEPIAPSLLPLLTAAPDGDYRTPVAAVLEATREALARLSIG